MDRDNAEGVRRKDLEWMLKRPDLVAERRAKGQCFLCCSPRVNEAALCDGCTSLLSEAEVRLVTRWMENLV